MQEIKTNGEITFGPLTARSYEGEKEFDKYYIDRVVKQVVKKTGEGEDDFILVDKIVESKRDIRKVINSQRDDVGIEAYLRSYQLAGEEVPDVEVGDDVQDFTRMPESLADAALLGEKSRALFASLPAELKGKMSYEEFMASFTNEMFESFIKKLQPQKEEKEGDKE